MKVIEKDGVTIKQLSPLKGVPFYGDWLTFLLVRGAAFETMVRNVLTKVWEEKIVPYDCLQQSKAILNEVTGSVSAICLNCGQLFPMPARMTGKRLTDDRLFNLSRIRVGGWVQTTEDEVISRKEILRRWKQSPVTRAGLGCPVCVEDYKEIVRLNEALNAQKSSIATTLAASAIAISNIEGVDLTGFSMEKCLHGLPMGCSICSKTYRPSKTLKLPTAYTAFLDVTGELLNLGERD